MVNNKRIVECIAVAYLRFGRHRRQSIVVVPFWTPHMNTGAIMSRMRWRWLHPWIVQVLRSDRMESCERWGSSSSIQQSSNRTTTIVSHSATQNVAIFFPTFFSPSFSSFFLFVGFNLRESLTVSVCVCIRFSHSEWRWKKWRWRRWSKLFWKKTAKWTSGYNTLP